MTAGFISGALATSLGHPLDTLKVRYQVRGASLYAAHSADVPANSAKPHVSALQSIRQLYRGVIPPMITTGAVQAVFFVVYERMRSGLFQTTPAAPDYYRSTFLSGGLAGIAISLVTNPITLVKVQLQTSVNMTVLQCYSKLYRQNGIMGLYRGMTPMMLMEGIGRGSFFTCYEYTKLSLSGGVDEASVPLWCRMAAASVSGTISWALIYPLDVVKSRIQMAHPTATVNSHPPVSLLMRDIVRSIYMEAGLTGIYRGLSFTLLRAAPISSIGLPLYELCRNFIGEPLATITEGLLAIE